MIKLYSIIDLLSGKTPTNTQISIGGWVRTRRDSKAGISFIQLNDGSCLTGLQIVVPNDLPNYDSEILKLTTGCALIAHGRLIESQGQGQRYEMQADRIEMMGWVEDPEHYPIQAKHHTFEYLREVAHLRPRTNTFAAVTRVRHGIAQAIHRYFHQNGFFWVNTPIITSSDCEGAGELFRVSALDLANLPRESKGPIDFSHDFFGQETFLTVSGQLNAESYALALSKVYTFGPTFRAENSNTSRHLAEFWMVEPEIAFADLYDCAKLAENLLKFIFQTVLKEYTEDMAFFEKWIEKDCIRRLEHMLSHNFEHMDYSEAIRILEKSQRKFEYPIAWGYDLQSEHERYIAEEHVKKPVVLMNYPKDIKSFYMRLNDDNKTVAAMDILAPGIGEIIGGSQREERLDYLDRRLEACGVPKEKYEWYRDLRRYGTVPHAGFGLGFERLINYVTGLNNVRDAIPFPRTPGHATF